VAPASSSETVETQELRAAGLRVTASRLAVLASVRQGGHVSAEEIARRARRQLGSLSTQAVYDVLHALSRAGLIRRIEPPGSPACFEARVGDNHHHLICRSCAVVVDVDCAVGHAPCLKPSETAGFAIDEAEIVYWGICPACRAAQPSGNPDPRQTREA